MPPRTPCGPEVPSVDEIHAEEVPLEQECRPEQPLVWKNFIRLGMVHAGALVGLYMLPSCHVYTLLFTMVAYWLGAVGITAGAHRLWSHRSYKAKLPFRIFLAACNSMAFQNDIIEWSRDHRVHHKYSETDADPHNAKRGFFFSHMGWLLMRKHPLVKEKGKLVSVDDLYRDPVCVWQRKVYLPSAFLMCFAVPTFIPWYFWGEDAWRAYFVCGFLRYVASLHSTWCVNSVAHLFGNKPYDRFINPVENLFVTVCAIGEGFHNFHHTFPQDYSTSELGMRFNVTTMLLDMMALIGQVYERKKMTPQLVQQRMRRTGDGTVGFGYAKLEPQPQPQTLDKTE